MFTDNENIESNPFNISEALCGDLEKKVFLQSKNISISMKVKLELSTML